MAAQVNTFQIEKLPQMHSSRDSLKSSLRHTTISRWLAILMICFSLTSLPVFAQEIWEYSPYRVQTWLAIDPALSMTDKAKEYFRKDLARQLDLIFGPTWKNQIDDAPAWLKHSMMFDLDSLEPNVLASGDMVLVVPKKNEATDSVRSLESFVDKTFDVMVTRKGFDLCKEKLAPDPTAIAITKLRELLKSEEKTSFQLAEGIEKGEVTAALISKTDMQLKADFLRLIISIGDYALVVPRKNATTDAIDDLAMFLERKLPVSTPKDSFEMLSERMKEDPITRLKSQLRPTDRTSAELAKDVSEGRISAAIVLKDDVSRQGDKLRTIVVRFDKQSDAFLDRHDKLYFLALIDSPSGPMVRVRELDCPTRRFSEVYSRTLYHPQSHLAAPIASLVRDCFTPVARIEESDPKNVKMRGRAAGLVVAEQHPVLVQVGDVMQAIVRRNDRNGQPSLLETVPWTFIVATDVQREHISATVFTGIRGGLEGRRNSRTQRYALKVKPTGTTTELQVVTQLAKDRPLAGTQIFQRLPGGDTSQPIGRTDWRGILPLQAPAEPPVATIELPSANPVTTPTSENAAADAKAAATTPETSPPTNPSPTATAANEDKAAAAPAAQAPAAEPVAPQVETKKITLRAPLMIYYVKNGETLLARLPIVVGLQPVVTAEVADDSRRLQAEAFLRGLQSETVDLVALRQVTAARIRMRIEEGKLPDAQKLMEELIRLDDYEKMARNLDDVQRQVLDPAGGAITPVAQMKIERMFQQTRELLQKYLQNDLVKKVEKELDAALKGGSPQPPSEPAPTAPQPSSTAPANNNPPANNSAAPSNQPSPPSTSAGPQPAQVNPGAPQPTPMSPQGISNGAEPSAPGPGRS